MLNVRNFFTLCLLACALPLTQAIQAQALPRCTYVGDLAFGGDASLRNFLSDLPCRIDTLRGSLYLGPGLTTLTPLLGLRYVGGELSLEAGALLENLYGLDSLTEVDDAVFLRAASVTEVTALRALRHVRRSADTIRPDGGSRGMFLELSILDDLGPLASLESIHGGRLNVSQCHRLSDLSPLSNVADVGSLVIDRCGVSAPLSFPLIDTLETLRIDQCHRLKAVDGFAALRSVKYFEVTKCDSVEYIHFDHPLSLRGPSNESRNYNQAILLHYLPRLRRVDVPGDRFLMDPDAYYLGASYFGLSQLEHLPSHGELDLGNFIFGGNPLPDRTLDLGFPRLTERWSDYQRGNTYNGAGYFLSSPDRLPLPTPDTIIVHEGALQLSFSKVPGVKIIDFRGAPLAPNSLQLKNLPELHTIHGLTNLGEAGILWPYEKREDTRLSIREAPLLQLEPGALDGARGFSRIELSGLSSLVEQLTFPATDSLEDLTLLDLPFDTVEVLSPGTYLGRSLRLGRDADSTRTQHFRIHAHSDSLGFHRPGSIYDDGGLYMTFNNLATSAEGLPGTETIRQLILGGLPSHERRADLSHLLPDLRTTRWVTYTGGWSNDDAFIRRLPRVGRLDRLDTEHHPPNGYDGQLTLSRMNELRDARAVCPLVASGTISTYNLFAVPPPFDTREGLLAYCDTVSLSTYGPERAWRAFRVSPTVQVAGGSLLVHGLDEVAGSLDYRLIGPDGRTVLAGTLHEHASASQRAALIALPADLPAGQYWLTARGHRDGRRGTALVIVQ